jgi:hypothetical protein
LGENCVSSSALTSFHTGILLVDDDGATAPPDHDRTGLILQLSKRITNLHESSFQLVNSVVRAAHSTALTSSYW